MWILSALGLGWKYARGYRLRNGYVVVQCRDRRGNGPWLRHRREQVGLFEAVTGIVELGLCEKRHHMKHATELIGKGRLGSLEKLWTSETSSNRGRIFPLEARFNEQK